MASSLLNQWAQRQDEEDDEEDTTEHEAELAKNDPRVKSVMNLTTVYGIGPKKSLELYDKFGINTISLLILSDQILILDSGLEIKAMP